MISTSNNINIILNIINPYNGIYKNLIFFKLYYYFLNCYL